jgi:hypothetical protein
MALLHSAIFDTPRNARAFTESSVRLAELLRYTREKFGAPEKFAVILPRGAGGQYPKQHEITY